MRVALPALVAMGLFAVPTLFTVTTTPALAHGGSYRGPAGEVPPNSREPFDPPPPTDPAPPQTPGGIGDGPETGGGNPGGPGTGDGDGGGPGTGGGGQPPDPGGSNPTGPGTGGPGGRRAGGKKAPGFQEWIYWWNFNKDDILALKARLARQRNVSSGGFHRFSRTHNEGANRIVPVTRAAVASRVVPALRDLLAQNDLNFDIRSAAALALAKIGDESIIESLRDMTLGQRTGRGKYHPVVRESAALGFGLLQRDTEDVREFLLQILADDELNASFVRPFAAVSLGLIGTEGDADEAVTAALLGVLEKKENRGGVKPAALVALGLLADADTVEPLLAMLETGRAGKGVDGELDDIELSFVVQALGRIGEPGLEAAGSETLVVDTLTDLLKRRRGRDVPKNVRRSAAIALGQLAPNTDGDTQRLLLTTLKTSALDTKMDPSTRNFATMAIGRMGALKGLDPKLRLEATATLRVLLNKAKPANTAQPYAALALGLVARAMKDEGLPAPEEAIRAPLRERFAETRSPLPRGAYAIALGLAGDPLAVPDLIEVLEDDNGDARLRGYVAVSLGMIGDHTARQAISDALTDGSNRDLRVQSAVAAGLIGDGSVIEPLVNILKSDEQSQYVLGSVALALGQIGDQRAVDPLLVISLDEAKQRPALTRALATVALGQIGDQGEVPTLSRVARDLNYRAPVKALIELLTIL